VTSSAETNSRCNNVDSASSIIPIAERTASSPPGVPPGASTSNVDVISLVSPIPRHGTARFT